MADPFSSQMSPVFAPPIAPPSAEERERIGTFVSSDEALELLRQDIRRSHELTAGPSTALASVRKIFDRANAQIEVSNADHRSANEYVADQPRLLARAADKVAPLGLFLESALGSKAREVGALQTRSDLERIGSAVDFFAALFWEEVKLAKDVELEAGLEEKVRLLLAMSKEEVRSKRGDAYVSWLSKKNWREFTVFRTIHDEYLMGTWRIDKHAHDDDDDVSTDLRIADYFKGETAHAKFSSDRVTTRSIDAFYDLRRSKKAERLVALVSKYQELSQRERSFFFPQQGEHQLHLKSVSEENKLEFKELSRTAMEELAPKLERLITREARGVISEENTETPPLPRRAPRLWTKHRLANELPTDFIRRTYEPWLGKGLSRPDLRRLDMPLYAALAKHVERHGLPDDFDLPTAKERNDRWIAKVKKGDEPLQFKDDAEMKRYLAAVQRRKGSKER